MNSESSSEGEDSSELLFNLRELQFFREKLDDFTLNVFRTIVRDNRNHIGTVKTRLENYRGKRFFYDQSFTILDAQGFIEKKNNGTMAPYYVTKRGMQLVQLLLDERKR
ncbi:hypothetical protein [Paenibacillus sp. Leaf72]|uniref:hypothetical protein n=1 Tax=Paenibacillus sp. Leaf72 TaxID=1736234 RepID=UPI0006FF74FD|nr:hypothetical protein [Paenibacillus sp. Leaf72]KQN97208.1 hypothetical protein ASF12_22105 [Paenibacillus sp. Leaf72]